MTRDKKRVIILAAILIAAVTILGAIAMFGLEMPIARAEEPTYYVTNENQGKVMLGDLCRRHDVLSVVLPGGKSHEWYTSDDVLQELVNDGLVEIFDGNNIYTYEDADRTILKGYTSSVAESLINILAVIPSNVKKIGGEGWSFPIEYHVIGLVWESNSQMTEIPDNQFKGVNLRFAILDENIKKIGEEAFYSNLNLKDIVMPGVVEIGKNALRHCTELYHISIPSSVTTIGEDAFTYNHTLVDVENNSDLDISTYIPSAFNIYSSENRSSGLHIWEKFENTTANDAIDNERKSISEERRKILIDRLLNNSLAFCYNTVRTSTLATLKTGTVPFQLNRWYFVGLNGLEDNDLDTAQYLKGAETEYYFPKEIDLNAERQYITYDYLDADGNKYINKFTTTEGGNPNTESPKVTKYDICTGSCYYRIFTRIFFADGTVENIGDFAFYASQVAKLYLPGSVKNIGENAFRITHRAKATSDSIIYLAKRPSKTDLINVGQYVFSIAVNWASGETYSPPMPDAYSGANRKIIFADKEDFDAENNRQTKFNGVNDTNVVFTYLVPIKLNVTDDDGNTTTTIDSYRLHGTNPIGEKYKYNYVLNVKDPTKGIDATLALSDPTRAIGIPTNGYTWSTKTVSMPNIEGNTSTVWYTDESYTTKLTADFDSDNNFITKELQKDVDAVNLYTRSIGDPKQLIENQTYQYNREVSASKTLTFDNALKLKTDTNDVSGLYSTSDTANFANFNGAVSQTSAVQNAGIYTIPILLNKEKWGVWDPEVHSYTRTVTVNRAEYDIANLNNFPEFIEKSGASLGGMGSGSEIYQYSDGGWYLYGGSNEGDDAPTTVTVLNSYARHTGKQIEINATPANSAMYSISATSGYLGTASSDYLAYFTLSLNNPNYVFSIASYEKNKDTFNKLGVSFIDSSDAMQNATKVNITKKWYIVIQNNWLIDSENEDDLSTPYSLLTFNGEATSTLPYEALFGANITKCIFLSSQETPLATRKLRLRLHSQTAWRLPPKKCL